MISTVKLKNIVHDFVLNQIDETAKRFNITTNLRLSHFLAQCDHESGGFHLVQECLYYSDLNRIVEIFRYNVDTDHDKVIEQNELENAKKYVRNPNGLANFVYANRMGNGNEASGDGWKFHGRGYIQLTGRDNYTKFSKFIGEDCITNSDLVAIKYPLASAGFFFDSNGLWSICDKGSDKATVIAVTKRVNGGINGLDERLKNFNKYFNILGS